MYRLWVCGDRFVAPDRKGHHGKDSPFIQRQKFFETTDRDMIEAFRNEMRSRCPWATYYIVRMK